MYRYRLYCPDCFGTDPDGCFNGGYKHSEEQYETPVDAALAAIKVTSGTPWFYGIVDEKGHSIVPGED